MSQLSQQPSEVEEQEIDHLVAQYGKDPRRFIGTIQGEGLTIDKALLKYRTAVIAINEGKSGGVDIQAATDELKGYLDQHLATEVEKVLDSLEENSHNIHAGFGKCVPLSAIHQERNKLKGENKE